MSCVHVVRPMREPPHIFKAICNYEGTPHIMKDRTSYIKAICNYEGTPHRNYEGTPHIFIGGRKHIVGVGL